MPNRLTEMGINSPRTCSGGDVECGVPVPCQGDAPDLHQGLRLSRLAGEVHVSLQRGLRACSPAAAQAGVAAQLKHPQRTWWGRLHDGAVFAGLLQRTSAWTTEHGGAPWNEGAKTLWSTTSSEEEGRRESMHKGVVGYTKRVTWQAQAPGSRVAVGQAEVQQERPHLLVPPRCHHPIQDPIVARVDQALLFGIHPYTETLCQATTVHVPLQLSVGRDQTQFPAALCTRTALVTVREGEPCLEGARPGRGPLPAARAGGRAGHALRGQVARGVRRLHSRLLVRLGRRLQHSMLCWSGKGRALPARAALLVERLAKTSLQPRAGVPGHTI